MVSLTLDAYITDAKSFGHGPSVVYVHGGFAGLARSIRDQSASTDWIHSLSRDIRLIRYRRRGCGTLSCPRSGYDLWTQAGDLSAVLDEVGVKRVHVFGSSAGGPIALMFAALWPERVLSVVLQGTALSILSPNDGIYEIAERAWADLALLGPQAAYKRRPTGIDAGFDAPWRRREAEAHGRLSDFIATESRLADELMTWPNERRTRYYAAELLSMRAYVDVDVTSVAARVHAPVLILHGEDDHVFPIRAAQRARAELADARLVVVSSARHGPVFETDEARRLLVDFVRSNERR